MPLPEGVIVKKQLPIIYMIDTSGSMSGDRIACVNNAMRESLKVIKEKIEDGETDADVKIGVLKFSTGAEWVTKDGLVNLEHFFWNDLTAGGLTDFGAALKELDSKLSKNAFLKLSGEGATGYAAPVLICMSDGQPTDNWEKTFDKIKEENAWFRGAKKVCIAIGEDADIEMLGRLCGNPKEGVIRSNDLESLKAFIVAVSATASMMGTSRMVKANGEKVEENTFIDSVKQNMSDGFDDIEQITGDDDEWPDEDFSDMPNEDDWN